MSAPLQVIRQKDQTIFATAVPVATGGCAWGFVGEGFFSGALTPGTAGGIDIEGTDLWVSATYPLLPAGVWTIQGEFGANINTTPTNMQVNMFLDNNTDGGGGSVAGLLQIRDFIDVVASVVGISTFGRGSWGGVVLMTEPWSPSVTIQNQISSTATITSAYATMRAFGGPACDTTIIDPGGG